MKRRIAVLTLALVGFMALGTALNRSENEFQALEAKVAALESVIAEKDAEIARLRARNAQLILRLGKYKAVCRKAGIDPEGEPGQIKPISNAPPNIQAFLDEMTERQVDTETFVLPVFTRLKNLSIGKIGQFTDRLTILQIIDGDQALVEGYTHYGAGSPLTRTVWSGSGWVTVGAPGGITSKKESVWLSNWLTGGYADDQKIKTNQFFEVIGTRQYETAAGSSRTVFELQPIEVLPYLPEGTKKLLAEKNLLPDAAND